jgi:GntR family transcriptional regulator
MANFPFQRLQADIAKLIAKTPAGQRLISEPELAKQMGVSRATLREAMRTFETQGVIRRRQGSGTYVVGKVPVIDAGLEVLESIETMAGRMNLEITVSDLHIEQLEADKEIAAKLGIGDGNRIIRIRRVIRADRRPAAYLVDILPESVIKTSDLPKNFHGSVLDFLLARGERLTTSRAVIGATNAAPDVAKPLEIQRDDVLLKFESQLFDNKNNIVDYSVSYFIPGYFHFHVNRRVGTS